MKSLDQWRRYFRSSNSDIFDIIDHAIMLAASDCPKEFGLRRDGITERLFSCKLTRCLGCDKVELAVSGDVGGVGDGGNDDDGNNNRDDGVEFEAGASKESKVNSSRDDNHGDMDAIRVSHYSFDEAEALTDVIDEESQFIGEVLRIKDILHNREESDAVLFESLRRLQLMELTMDCLQTTKIGKAVNPLRKHGSKDIRQLARTLIDGWKEIVEEWAKATAKTAIAESEGTPDSINPSVVDEEEGLPSPPMDEGAFFVAPTGSIEFSQFFEGMDDIGNPRQSGQFNENCENGRKPSMNSQNIEKRKLQASSRADITAKDNKSQPVRTNEAAIRPNKPVDADSGPGRPLKSSEQKKANVEPKMQPKMENNTITRRPLAGQQDKSKCSEDVKLEATKRKLQERYQQAENAKRQRTVQVVELNDLPKQAVAHRNPHFKTGNHNRNSGHARR